MRDRVRRMPPGQVQAFGFAGEMPKVMIGVTMETAADAQIKVPDGVDASEATVITRVVEGLPAEKAGLKEGDIVVQVNGESSAAPDDIREAIKDKDAGDELKLRVIREGSEKDIVIALAAYDGGKLGSPRVWGFGQGGDSMLGSPHEMSDDDLKRLEKFRTELEKTSAELQRLGVQLGNSTDPKERERLGAQMAELGAKMATLGADMGDVTGGGAQWRFLAPGQDNFDIRRLPRMRLERGMEGGAPKAFVFTPEDGQTQAGEADRIQRLDERLERLERLLEKVVEEKEKSKN
jgi:membrane-associated protease RseP (regulator of RpoE activity)